MNLTTASYFYIGDIRFDVTGVYSPPQPAVMYLKNGDPGYPAEDADFDIDEVTINGVCAWKLFEIVHEADKSLMDTIIENVDYE